jgi:hypothetical protein
MQVIKGSKAIIYNTIILVGENMEEFLYYDLENPPNE